MILFALLKSADWWEQYKTIVPFESDHIYEIIGIYELIDLCLKKNINRVHFYYNFDITSGTLEVEKFLKKYFPDALFKRNILKIITCI